MIYICLLRGVNVSGKNTLPMADLREAMTGLDCWDVRTYVQSGNVVFSAEESEDLAERIEAHIDAVFGIQTPAFLYTLAGFRRIIAGNPFLPQHEEDSEYLYVTYLKGKADRSTLTEARQGSQGRDTYIVSPCGVYLYCPDGYGRTKFNNHYFEKLLRLSATTRNWKTTLALETMAQA